MKRRGKEILVGPFGRHCCHLIKYFEGIWGVTKIRDGHNPATWMLEVTSSAQEIVLGIDFAEVYKTSEMYRYDTYFYKVFIEVYSALEISTRESTKIGRGWAKEMGNWGNCFSNRAALFRAVHEDRSVLATCGV